MYIKICRLIFEKSGSFVIDCDKLSGDGDKIVELNLVQQLM